MYRSETSAERPLVYFVKLARFSNTNAYVEEQLRRHFPEATLEVLDLAVVFKRPSWALLGALARVCVALAADCARGRFWQGPLKGALMHRLLREPLMFAAMSRTARRTLERDRRRLWFTFQTQSMWNNALAGVPNFVYTDSTILANLYFTPKDFRCLPPVAWLERERAIYADASRVFVMSGHVGRSLTELYGIDPARVKQVRVGANLDSVPACPRPAPPDNKTILFVGMEWDRKGGPELVAAFRRLPRRHEDARLLIVGASPAVDAPRCEVVGRVPAREVSAYYARAAIFCMPTRIEPFGIVFIEAMMHAVAIAVPRHGAMLDYVEERQTGVLFQPGNCEDIARALTWLLDNPDERQAIARRGLEAVRSVYSWDAVGERLHAEITSSLAASVRQPRGTFGSGPRWLPDREHAE